MHSIRRGIGRIRVQYYRSLDFVSPLIPIGAQLSCQHQAAGGTCNPRGNSSSGTGRARAAGGAVHQFPNFFFCQTCPRLAQIPAQHHIENQHAFARGAASVFADAVRFGARGPAVDHRISADGRGRLLPAGHLRSFFLANPVVQGGVWRSFYLLRSVREWSGQS